MKVFVKSSELSLENGKYVYANGTPVSNKEFIFAQREAERLVTIANLTKGKDFVGKKPDNLQSVIEEADRLLYSKKQIEYIKTPSAPKRSLQDQLKEEAMSWHNHQTSSSKTAKINDFMSKFDVIHEFEEIGLFFEQDIVTLNKIYTIAEITEAAEIYFSIAE